MKLERLSSAIVALGIAGMMSATNAQLPDGQPLTKRVAPNSLVRNSSTRALPDVSNAKPWSNAAGYPASTVVSHGTFEGKNLYWVNAWWGEPTDQPGMFADSGGTSAWGLINSKAYGDKKEYQWVGWNSKAGKWEVTHDNNWVFTETQKGDWGDQIDSKGAGAYVPTWRDGAEGAYTMIHDDIGSMGFNTCVKPANDVAVNFPEIRVGWGMMVQPMDAEEWAGAKKMVEDGQEIVCHSYDHTSAADQWQWMYHGDTLPAVDPSIPKEIKNLIVDSTITSTKDITIDVPYVDYKDGDVNQPETKISKVTFTVSSDYQYIVDSTYNADWGEYEYTYKSKGKIKATHKGWSDAANANVSMLKMFCVPGWTASRYKVNIKGAKELIDKNIYEKVNSKHFRSGKRLEYYVYPYDAYCTQTHDSLFANGINAARGGAKSGTPLPGDFYHPFRIDFDAFFMLDDKAETVFPNNPHQRISLSGLVDRIWKTKGYMIREFHACSDVSYWDDANSQEKGGWWGGIPKSLYTTHFEYLKQLIQQHKIAVYTPSEAVKYRLTANAVKSVKTWQKDGNNWKLELETETLSEKYQDEISVIVKFDEACSKMDVQYSDNSKPRIAPRKMDSDGKAWSVSVNPFKGVVTVIPNGDFVGINNIAKTAAASKVRFAGILDNQISLELPAGKFTAELFDVSGRLIKSVNITSANGVVKTGLNVNGIASRMMILNVKKAGVSVLSQSIILNK